MVQWLGLSWWLGGNLPADAGHVSSVPDPGRFHMPWSTQPRAIATALVLQSLQAAATEASALESLLRNNRSHRNAKPAHRN